MQTTIKEKNLSTQFLKKFMEKIFMQKKLKDSILKTTGAGYLLICLIVVIMWFYYYSTIAANSFWLDQYKLIEFSREKFLAAIW